MPRVVISAEHCTGCALCEEFCPARNLELSQRVTPKGTHPAQACDDTKCSGCKICVLMCPAAAISIYKDPPEAKS
jgi:2-oxoglutarate ferredoxin oxidoreductase subunit delta